MGRLGNPQIDDFRAGACSRTAGEDPSAMDRSGRPPSASIPRPLPLTLAGCPVGFGQSRTTRSRGLVDTRHRWSGGAFCVGIDPPARVHGVSALDLSILGTQRRQLRFCPRAGRHSGERLRYSTMPYRGPKVGGLHSTAKLSRVGSRQTSLRLESTRGSRVLRQAPSMVGVLPKRLQCRASVPARHLAPRRVRARRDAPRVETSTPRPRGP